MLKKFKKHIWVIFGLVLVFLLFMLTRPMGTHDSFWIIPTCLSILTEFNVNLDEFITYGLKDSYAAIKINGHYYNYFPYGITFLVLPIIGAIKPFLSEFLFFRYHKHIELLCASVLVIVALYFLYILFCFFVSRRWAALLTISMGLCTPLFTSASRALWQHSGSILLISLSLFLLVYSLRRNKRILPLLGIVLVFAYAVRPTNIISLFLISLFVLFNFRKERLNYGLAVILAMASFFLFNYWVFGDFVHPYYRTARLSVNFNLLKTAVIGNLFSPNRGFFIWSPFLLFAFLAFFFVKRRNDSLIFLAVSIICSHIFVISTFPHWWAGHSVGPRFMTDVVPFFGLLLCFTIKRFNHSYIFKVSFLFLIIISFLVQFSAAVSKNTQLWNIRGGDINDTPERIWDWHKPQFYPFD